MKMLTDDEILAKLKELWPDVGPSHAGDDFGFKVEHEDEKVEITVTAMYESPGLEFAQLKSLSELFGTENINDDSFNYGGCETCDYGSRHGFTLTIRPESRQVKPENGSQTE